MIESMLRGLEDPHSRHALLVHLPIAFGLLGIVPAVALALGLAATRRRLPAASLACVAWAGVLMVGLGLAAGAGEDAYERVEASVPALTAVEHEALETHEELGETAWAWAMAPLVLAVATLLPQGRLRAGAAALLVAAWLGIAGYVAVIGHTGGVLVYEHGLGVPVRGVPDAGPGRAVGGREAAAARPDHDDD